MGVLVGLEEVLTVLEQIVVMVAMGYLALVGNQEAEQQQILPLEVVAQV